MSNPKKTASPRSRKSRDRKAAKAKASPKTGVNPVGRPTAYGPHILEITRDYMVNFKKYDDVIPTIAGLADRIGVRRETLQVWAKEEGKEEFSNIIGQLMAKQEKGLVTGGLKGDFNSTITKLLLSKHGYREGHELMGKDGAPIETVPIAPVDITDKDSVAAYREFCGATN